MQLLASAGFPRLSRAVMREIARVMVPSRRSIWHAADGRELRICDMSDAHLLNCYNKCRRDRSFRPELFSTLERECVRRRLPTDGSYPAWLRQRNAAARKRLNRLDTTYLRRIFHELDMLDIPNK